MSQALLAIGSLLLGVALNEWIRRSNRIEAYAASIFQKRFNVYEQLWSKIKGAKEAADTVIHDTTLAAEQRHRHISEVVLDIAGFCDSNDLYLNEEATMHCCTLFMGVEDIQSELDESKKEELISRYRNDYLRARDIIRAETGLRRMDELFRVMTKAKYSSDVIEYFRDVQKELGKRSRDGRRAG